MRVKFEAQLERLNVELITMGALCEEVISGAAKALLDGDSGLRETVLAAERDINQKERDIESLCMKLLLQQQPVARDLRTISSALKMISDMGPPSRWSPTAWTPLSARTWVWRRQ